MSEQKDKYLRELKEKINRLRSYKSQPVSFYFMTSIGNRVIDTLNIHLERSHDEKRVIAPEEMIDSLP